MTKKLIWLFVLLASPGLAWAQGSRFDSTAQKTVQNFIAPIPGATIVVCTSSGTGTPCSPVAPIYTDQALTQQITGSTFTADSNGNFGFWAAAGNYTYSITAAGVTGKLYSVTLPANPSSIFAGNNTYTGSNTFTQQIVSSVTTGTAPFSIASTTVTPNLNAQLHNGLTAPASAIVGINDTQTLTNKTLTSPTLNTPTINSATMAGSTSIATLNSTQMCDQFSGATADVKIQNCLAALPSTGGVADATGLIGTQTIASEIDVGNSTTKFVNLRLPCGAVWNVTITGGTTSAIKVFGGSSVTANCAQNNAMQLKLGAAGNVASLVTNDQTCANCSVKISGFMIFGNTSATVGNALLDLSNLGNNAEISSLNIVAFKTKGLWIHDTNSESVFTAINVDGGQQSGAIPCTIETTASSLETLRFYGLDCQHPGATKNVLVINGHGNSNLTSLSFFGSHFEGSNTDTTTPFISIADAKNIAFYSPLFNSLDSGTTNWGIQISETVANITDDITLINAVCPNGNCVNDTIRTKQVSGGTGQLPYYSYVTSTTTVGSLYINGFTFPEIAAPSAIGGSGPYDGCYGDSTAHLPKCKYNGGNFHGLRMTEVGTCAMSSGTCTVTWGSSFSSAPLCNATWNGTGTLTGILKAVPSTTNCVVTSSVGTDSATVQVVGTANPN